MVPYIDQYISNQILIKVKDQHNDQYSVFDSRLKSIFFFTLISFLWNKSCIHLYVKLLLSQLKQIMLAMKVFSSHQLFCTQIFVGGKHMCSLHMLWCKKSTTEIGDTWSHGLLYVYRERKLLVKPDRFWYCITLLYWIE